MAAPTTASRRALLLGAVGALAAAAADRAATAGPDISLSQWILRGKGPNGFSALLEAGADPLRPDLDGDTAVHHAAAAQDPIYLRILLARGVPPDVPNARSGTSPLVSAMTAERDRQFDMLLAAGASVRRADRMGNTPLHVAAQVNDPGRVLRLLEAGAPATARNRQGQTFQRYLFMTREDLLNAEARGARRAVILWLRSRGIPVEAD